MAWDGTTKPRHAWACPSHDSATYGCPGPDCCCADRHTERPQRDHAAAAIILTGYAVLGGLLGWVVSVLLRWAV